MKENTKGLFISWTKTESRSAMVARHLGIPVEYFFVGPRKVIILLPYRYLVLSVKTLIFLLRERPDFVITQMPPHFSGLIAYIYALLTNNRFAMDSHSATFWPGGWSRLLWLHRFLSNRADTTIVANRDIQARFEELGCKTTRLGYTPIEFQSSRPYPLGEGFNICMPCSFDEDEPVSEILEAAERLSDVNIYITGNLKYAPKDLVENAPANCHFTGFLDKDLYNGLLKTCDAVMALTTIDETLLLSAFEAISLERPLITSDWPVLKNYFSKGAVYVDNTAEGIYNGILAAQKQHTSFLNGIQQLKLELTEDYERQLSELKNILFSGSLPHPKNLSEK